MIRARSITGVSAHAGNAAWAAFTATSTSFEPASGTKPITSPVDGLNTDEVGRCVGRTHSPSIRNGHSSREEVGAVVIRMLRLGRNHLTTHQRHEVGIAAKELMHRVHGRTISEKLARAHTVLVVGAEEIRKLPTEFREDG